MKERTGHICEFTDAAMAIAWLAALQRADDSDRGKDTGNAWAKSTSCLSHVVARVFRVDSGLGYEMKQAIEVEREPYNLFSFALDQKMPRDIRQLAANRLNDFTKESLTYIQKDADQETLEQICRSNLFPTTYKSFARAAKEKIMGEKKSWRDLVKVHPCADTFPMLEEDELRKLGEDIKANGIKDPIALFRSGDDIFVVDGRNRLAAIELVGINFGRDWPGSCSFPAVNWLHKDTDVGSYVISKNIHRRHLSKQQQADLIVKAIQASTNFANLARSVDRDSNGRVQGSMKDPIKEKAVTEGKKIGISPRTIERAIAKDRGPTLPPRKKSELEDTLVEVATKKEPANSNLDVENISRKAVSFLKRELEHASQDQILTVMETILDAFGIDHTMTEPMAGNGAIKEFSEVDLCENSFK